MKKVPAGNTGLKKLPKTVRNKIGFAKKGGVVKKAKGMKRGGVKMAKGMKKGGVRMAKGKKRGGKKTRKG